MTSHRHPQLLSVVIPLLNEEDSVAELHRRVSQVLEGLDIEFELIFVDDGSSDRSLPTLLDIQRRDRRVRILELSRNFGHQMALSAGLDHARGDAVITMDADLQHPPELITQLITKWQEGFDIVYTCREGTEGTGPAKNLTSRFFYFLISRLSEVEVPAGAADFRILDGRVVRTLQSMPERSLFLRGLIRWVGYRQAELRYKAPARQGSGSRYSIVKMIRFAVDGVTSFSSLPLYMAALIGLAASFLGFVYAAYAVYARLVTGEVVEGWTSVMVAVLVLGGIQLMALGVQGVYLGRIFKEVKGRPRYVVRRLHGFGPNGHEE